MEGALCLYPQTQAGHLDGASAIPKAQLPGSCWHRLLAADSGRVRESTHHLHSHSMSHSTNYKGCWEIYSLFVPRREGRGFGEQLTDLHHSVAVRIKGSNA